jgi:hypothetical protein
MKRPIRKKALWRKVLHRLGIKIDLWLIVQAYTEHENLAIDIYNSWNHGLLSRHEAIMLFTDEMLQDRGACLWHSMIWERDELRKKE